LLLAHALRQWPLRRVQEQHNAEHRVAQLFSNRVQPLGGASLVLDLAAAEVSFVRFSAAIRRTSQLARELTAGSLSLSDPDTGGRQNFTPRHQQRHKHKHSQRHSPSRASKGTSHGTPFAVSSIILPISRPDGFLLDAIPGFPRVADHVEENGHCVLRILMVAASTWICDPRGYASFVRTEHWELCVRGYCTAEQPVVM
jgi:hypothetical protein